MVVLGLGLRQVLFEVMLLQFLDVEQRHRSGVPCQQAELFWQEGVKGFGSLSLDREFLIAVDLLIPSNFHFLILFVELKLLWLHIRRLCKALMRLRGLRALGRSRQTLRLADRVEASLLRELIDDLYWMHFLVACALVFVFVLCDHHGLLWMQKITRRIMRLHPDHAFNTWLSCGLGHNHRDHLLLDDCCSVWRHICFLNQVANHAFVILNWYRRWTQRFATNTRGISSWCLNYIRITRGLYHFLSEGVIRPIYSSLWLISVIVELSQMLRNVKFLFNHLVVHSFSHLKMLLQLVG